MPAGTRLKGAALKLETYMHCLESNVINECDRVVYAKTFRSQLTDKELILIRYNCLYERGEKMRYPVFHYNILKHLPIINLLEFTEYRKQLSKQEISILNDEVIEWRKQICNLFKRDNFGGKKLYKRFYTYNYELSISVDNNNMNYMFIIKRKVSENINEINIETVLNKFSDDLLEELFVDINTEILFYSDFRIYNRQKNKIYHRTFSDGETSVFAIIIKNVYPIIVSYFQVKDPL